MSFMICIAVLQEAGGSVGPDLITDTSVTVTSSLLSRELCKINVWFVKQRFISRLCFRVDDTPLHLRVLVWLFILFD